MYEVDMIICIICVVFCIIGVLICDFKMYYLISGYNTTTKEGKKKINIKVYAKVMRNILFSSSFLLFLGMFVFQYLDVYKYYMLIFFPVVIIGMVIFLVTYGKSSKINLNDK
jgi:hypothetical protein